MGTNFDLNEEHYRNTNSCVWTFLPPFLSHIWSAKDRDEHGSAVVENPRSHFFCFFLSHVILIINEASNWLINRSTDRRIHRPTNYLKKINSSSPYFYSPFSSFSSSSFSSFFSCHRRKDNARKEKRCDQVLSEVLMIIGSLDVWISVVVVSGN